MGEEAEASRFRGINDPLSPPLRWQESDKKSLLELLLPAQPGSVTVAICLQAAQVTYQSYFPSSSRMPTLAATVWQVCWG